MYIQFLEERRCLSVTVSVDADGILRVSGDERDSSISVVVDIETTEINTGGVQSIDTSTFRAVHIDGKAGTDFITLQIGGDLELTSTVLGGLGNDDIFLNGSNNGRIATHGGPGDDRFLAQNLSETDFNAVTLHGGAGNDYFLPSSVVISYADNSAPIRYGYYDELGGPPATLEPNEFDAGVRVSLTEIDRIRFEQSYTLDGTRFDDEFRMAPVPQLSGTARIFRGGKGDDRFHARGEGAFDSMLNPGLIADGGLGNDIFYSSPVARADGPAELRDSRALQIIGGPGNDRWFVQNQLQVPSGNGPQGTLATNNLGPGDDVIDLSQASYPSFTGRDS